MKQIQRNGLKFKIFNEEELKHCFNMSEKDIEIILEYQDKFPELMLEDGQGFCIDARRLHDNLKISKHLTQWLKPYIDNKNKYGFEENVDFTRIDGKVNPTNGIPIIEYMLTLDMAKELCMVSKSENGKLCRKYFISIEKTLKSYKEWNSIREPEKLQANLLKDSIRRYCERNGGFNDTRYTAMKCREFNTINECLTGYKAVDLRVIHECKDDITRDRLNTETNNAILELQKIDIMLIDSDMNFEMRKQFINKNCENNYKHLYIKK